MQGSSIDQLTSFGKPFGHLLAYGLGLLPWDTCLSRPSEGFATWDDWQRDIGLPGRELGIAADSIIDPNGAWPRIWLHVVPDAKVIKNRLHLHLNIHVSDSRSDPLATRAQRVDAEARRLADLGATITRALGADGLDHYAVGMKDPEAQRVRHQLTPRR